MSIVYSPCMTKKKEGLISSRMNSGALRPILVNQMWWGLLLGILSVGLLNFVSKATLQKILGQKKGLTGVIRASLAGIVLDMCSHGILLIGMKLYRQGLSLGQTMAFLIASPWNSFSFTFVLFIIREACFFSKKCTP